MHLIQLLRQLLLAAEVVEAVLAAVVEQVDT
jgi:hypothetical protein